MTQLHQSFYLFFARLCYRGKVFSELYDVIESGTSKYRLFQCQPVVAGKKWFYSQHSSALWPAMIEDSYQSSPACSLRD